MALPMQMWGVKPDTSWQLHWQSGGGEQADEAFWHYKALDPTTFTGSFVQQNVSWNHSRTAQRSVRSGDWDGHGIWFTSFSCSSNHSVTTGALWMGALASYMGIAMVDKIMGNWACPAFLYMILKMMGCELLRNHICVEAPAFKILCIPHLLECFLYFGNYLYVLSVGKYEYVVFTWSYCSLSHPHTLRYRVSPFLIAKLFERALLKSSSHRAT